MKTAADFPALRRPLVFGDDDQIAALQTMEADAEEEERRRKQPLWSVTCTLWKDYEIRAKNMPEAEYIANDMFWDETGIFPDDTEIKKIEDGDDD